MWKKISLILKITIFLYNLVTIIHGTTQEDFQGVKFRAIAFHVSNKDVKKEGCVIIR